MLMQIKIFLFKGDKFFLPIFFTLSLPWDLHPKDLQHNVLGQMSVGEPHISGHTLDRFTIAGLPESVVRRVRGLRRKTIQNLRTRNMTA